jgi:hypothetical protein
LTDSNPWAHGPHGRTIARDIPVSHSDHPMSVWLSHFPSSHVRMGYPIDDNMSQSVRGPVSKKNTHPTALPPYRHTIILPYHHSCTTIPHYCLIAPPPYCPTASRWWQWMYASWISVVWDVAQYNCQFVLHRLTAWDIPSHSRTSHLVLEHPIHIEDGTFHLVQGIPFVWDGMSHLVQSIPFVWDGTSHLVPEHPICVRWDIPSYARASHSCKMGRPILYQGIPFM